MEERNIRQILRRYLLGDAHENDIKAVDGWYQSFDEAPPVTLSPAESDVTRQEIWDRIAPVLEEGGVKESKVRRLPAWLRVAAVILVIAGGVSTYLLLHKKNDTPIAYTTYSTAIGQKKKITLQDGSLITLDAGTTIRIQDDFSKDRKIEMVDGQVFFDVKTDAERPFIVRSEGLTTTVLGTSFTVSSYKGLNNISIGVVTGKVRVASDTAALSVLEKEEELVFNKTSRKYKKAPLDESLTAWQEGRLLMNDLTFDEMAIMLKKNYGVDVVPNDDAIRRTRYTTELLTGMRPLQAIQVLAAIHNLKIREKDHQVILSK